MAVSELKSETVGRTLLKGSLNRSEEPGVHHSKPSPLSVSVVIPAYNRLDMLRRVLDGFLAESRTRDFEVILVDDGSDPPARELVGELGNPELLRLVSQPNQGRGGALNTGLDHARGEVVIFCDSDIVPEPGFVAEHVAFHVEQPSQLATHLGALEWGCDAGLYGALLGPRSNPRLIDHTGPVDWTLWYTDNWSFKRSLFEANGLRFDAFFRRWGWEELELARRLEGLGATNTLTGTARGRHLKAPDLESVLRNFRRSVPNLLYLAKQAPDDPRVAQWMCRQIESESALAAAEAFLRSSWERVVELDVLAREKGADGLVSAGALHVRQLAVAFSDAVFSVGIARGFREELTPRDWQGFPQPPRQDAQEILRLTDLAGLLYLVGTQLGHEGSSFAHLDHEGKRLLSAAGADPLFAQRFWQVTEAIVERVTAPSRAAG